MRVECGLILDDGWRTLPLVRCGLPGDLLARLADHNLTRLGQLWWAWHRGPTLGLHDDEREVVKALLACVPVEEPSA